MAKFNSVFLPIDLVDSTVIQNPYAKLLYWCLAARARKGRVAGLTRDYFAKKLKTTVDRISSLMGQLVELGLVVRIRNSSSLVYLLPRGPKVPKIPGKFTVVPKAIILNSRLAPQARIILVGLRTLAFANEGGWVVPQTKLARVVGFSTRTIRRFLPSLQASGLLVLKKFFIAGKKYKFMYHWEVSDGYIGNKKPVRRRPRRRSKGSPRKKIRGGGFGWFGSMATSEEDLHHQNLAAWRKWCSEKDKAV